MRRGFQAVYSRAPESSARARRAVIAVAGEWLTSNALDDLVLAVGEAVANAIVHGKGSSLTVSCYRDRDRVIVDVQDEGLGFALKGPLISLPAPMSQSGYGLYIMQNLADAVEILDDGRCIRIVKCVPVAFEQSHEDVV